MKPMDHFIPANLHASLEKAGLRIGLAPMFNNFAVNYPIHIDAAEGDLLAVRL
jgi:hypothetical protein